MKTVSKENALELVTLSSGEQLTRWEKENLINERRIAKRRLSQELKELNKPLENGYSRVQMGSIRAREIEAQIKNLNKFEKKTGYEFKRLKERIHSIGTYDYSMRKAITYRENYFSMLETYKNFDNYEKLFSKLQSIKNPIDFYEYVSQNELLADITFMYDMNMNLGLTNSNEQLSFNQMLESIGIEV